nr:MAG TPA: hypothetical protein [Caudoviricetes sp.]
MCYCLFVSRKQRPLIYCACIPQKVCNVHMCKPSRGVYDLD